MNLTSDTIKQGISNVGDYRMEYTITYNGENKVSKIEAQVKKAAEGKAPVHSGYASFISDTGRYSFQVNNLESADRKALIEDFENTIADLTK